MGFQVITNLLKKGVSKITQIQILQTYHVDLRHGVDENDAEDGDGEAQQEGAGQVPQDAPERQTMVIVLLFISDTSNIRYLSTLFTIIIGHE